MRTSAPNAPTVEPLPCLSFGSASDHRRPALVAKRPTPGARSEHAAGVDFKRRRVHAARAAAVDQRKEMVEHDVLTCDGLGVEVRGHLGTHGIPGPPDEAGKPALRRRQSVEVPSAQSLSGQEHPLFVRIASGEIRKGSTTVPVTTIQSPTCELVTVGSSPLDDRAREVLRRHVVPDVATRAAASRRGGRASSAQPRCHGQSDSANATGGRDGRRAAPPFAGPRWQQDDEARERD